MGAWGIGHFENDEALDWVGDLSEASGVKLIEDVLKPRGRTFLGIPLPGGARSDEYLEASNGAKILCAAEMIAALNGRPAAGLPEPASEWLSANKGLNTSLLIPQALQKIERVLAERSELRELWEEGDQYDEWKANVLELQSRLRSLGQ